MIVEAKPNKIAKIEDAEVRGPAKRGGGLGGVANATSRIPTAEDEEIGDFIRLQPTRIRQTGPSIAVPTGAR